MIYLDLWGRTIGMTYDEFSTMPMGELHDMIAAYQILNGAEEAAEEKYIPCLR